MDHLSITLAIHLIGVLMWIGASFSAGLLAAWSPPEHTAETAANLRRLVRRVAVPGLLLAWIGGLGRLIPEFGDVYARAGWMHTKLLLVLVISGLTGAMSARLGRLAQGEGMEGASSLRTFGLIILASAAAVVLLAVLKPG